MAAFGFSHGLGLNEAQVQGHLAAHDPKPWIALYVDGYPALFAPWTYQRIDPSTVAFGFNGLGFTNTQRTFSGTLSAISSPNAPAARRDPILWQASLPEGKQVQLKLRFATTPSNVGRPIVQTGIPGKSDLISAHSVRFGFDHWGFGGIVSNPLEVYLETPHTLALSVSSWNSQGYGVGGPARIVLTCDGKPVIDAMLDTHPWSQGRFFLLANLNGASTAFDGRLVNGQVAFPRPDRAP